MPIPIPVNGDLGACIRFLRKEKPGMKSDQRVAICLSLARKGKKKEKK